MIEMDLTSRIIDLIWELIEVICSVQLIKDERTMTIFIKMLPKKVFYKAT